MIAVGVALPSVMPVFTCCPVWRRIVITGLNFKLVVRRFCIYPDGDCDNSPSPRSRLAFGDGGNRA